MLVNEHKPEFLKSSKDATSGQSLYLRVSRLSSFVMSSIDAQNVNGLRIIFNMFYCISRFLMNVGTIYKISNLFVPHFARGGGGGDERGSLLKEGRGAKEAKI